MDAMGNRPRTASIHILDDDSLLHVFYLYRPFLLGEDQDNDAYLWGGNEGWDRGRWWFKLAHVCQRWRKVILGSASYLELFLVCTNGTPVADMLAHSLPLPLVVDYLFEHDNIAAEEEEAIVLALKQRDRIRRVRLDMPVTSLQKFIVAIEEEYPILEYLGVMLVEDSGMSLIFPETLQAPHLRYLTLTDFVLPIGSRLLATAVGLISLCLLVDHPSSYFHPNTLLQWLSFMPQLETILIHHSCPDSNHDVEGQLAHTPIITPIALPNLHRFTFQGYSTYLEALVNRITTPRLEKLEIIFFNQPTFFIPHSLQFINTTENLRYNSAGLGFSDENFMAFFCPHEEFEMYAASIFVDCCHLDMQVSSAAQIFNSLSQMFSAVEHLTFEHEEHTRSSEEHNQVDTTEWRRLLSPFRNVKTLRVADGLIEELSRCLQLEDGEPPLELLPGLRELRYSGSGDTGDRFTSFIDARQNTDRPISLVRRSPSPSPDRSSSVSITQANNEAGSDRDT
jgi:hypothetical protein